MSETSTGIRVDPRAVDWRATTGPVGDGLPVGAFRPRLFLQLPRVADEYGVAASAAVREEAERVAARLRASLDGLDDLLRAPSRAPRVDELQLAEIDESLARLVLERLHYLGSARPHSTNLAGLAEGRAAAVLTISALDVGTLASGLARFAPADEIGVLSRVFALGWAPANSVSYLLARVTGWLRERRPTVRVLITYVNPNVGFSGASYRAANWTLVAREHGTRYAYLDGDYVTDRVLARAFGTSDPATLRGRLGARVEWSRMALAPLDVYAYAVDRRLREELQAHPPLDLPRPTP